MMRRLRQIFQMAVLALCLTRPAVAQGQNFNQAAWESWLKTVKQEAVARGIRPEIAGRELDGLEFDPDVIRQDSRQPASRMSFAEYKTRAVSQARIERGRLYYRQQKEELDKFASQYGVSAPVVVALLGIESDYGSYTGNYGVIRSLATLAFGAARSTEEAARARRALFHGHIYYALKMVQDGVVESGNFRGSWAGASGINQHMPESYYRQVVDGDNDGDRDIWDPDDLSDVFATTASHLKDVGWVTGQRWGREVVLPDGFKEEWLGRQFKRPLQEWSNMGIRLPGGTPIPAAAGMTGSVVAPDGIGGQAYMVYDNFGALRRWNASDYFVLAVGSLADQIAVQP